MMRSLNAEPLNSICTVTTASSRWPANWGFPMEASGSGARISSEIRPVGRDLPTRQGWLYLAVVMDLFGRVIQGYKMAENLACGLVASALHQTHFQCYFGTMPVIVPGETVQTTLVPKTLPWLSLFRSLFKKCYPSPAISETLPDRRPVRSRPVVG